MGNAQMAEVITNEDELEILLNEAKRHFTASRALEFIKSSNFSRLCKLSEEDHQNTLRKALYHLTRHSNDDDMIKFTKTILKGENHNSLQQETIDDLHHLTAWNISEGTVATINQTLIAKIKGFSSKNYPLAVSFKKASRNASIESYILRRDIEFPRYSVTSPQDLIDLYENKDAEKRRRDNLALGMHNKKESSILLDEMTAVTELFLIAAQDENLQPETRVAAQRDGKLLFSIIDEDIRQKVSALHGRAVDIERSRQTLRSLSLIKH